MRWTATFSILGLALLAGCKADLLARHPDLTWTSDSKQMEVSICNVGCGDAGQFLVYFDLDEEPVSPNNRPQATRSFPGMAARDSERILVEFDDLAHPDNANLANVYQITIRVDPKDKVVEENEDNNVLVVPLPGP